MNIKEVADKIDKARLIKVKALANFMDFNVNKDREDIISEIKNDYRYKIITDSCEELETDVIKEFGKSIDANVNQQSRTYIIKAIREKCKKMSLQEDTFKSPKSTNKSKEYTKDVGYVYVMVSSEKPELVKIGMTKRKPEKRAKELSSSTGVSMPYIVAYKSKVNNPTQVEKTVHERLSNKRVNPDREFFEVETSKAIRTIEQVK